MPNLKIESKPKTILELYENHPERWTQRVNARTEKWGEVCRASDPRACRWCLWAAISYIYGMHSTKFFDSYYKLQITLGTYGLWGTDIVGYNDSSDRNHQEIVNLVREAGV